MSIGDPGAMKTEIKGWLGERLREAEDKLDRILSDMPEGRLDAQRRIAEALGSTPKPVLLHAVVRLADENAGPAVRTGLGRKIVIYRIMVDLLVRDLTETKFDPDLIQKAAPGMPGLPALIGAPRKEVNWLGNKLAPRDRETLQRLCKEVLPGTEIVNAYAVLVPMLDRMIQAARSGSIRSVAHVSEQEATLFEAALATSGTQPVPCQVWLEAAALGAGMSEDLQAWIEVRRAAVRAMGVGHDVAAEEGSPAPADDEARSALLQKLRSHVPAYNILVERLQRQQDTARASGQAEVARKTAAVQRALFSVYLRLAAVARNTDAPLDDEAGPPSEEVRSETTEDIYIDALTMRLFRRSGTTDLIGEQRQKKILISVAAGLGVMAITVNAIFFLQDRNPAFDMPSPGELAPVMKVQDSIPMGPVMFSQVPSADWNGLSESEKVRRMEDLGRVAGSHGFDRVLVLDESAQMLGHSDGVAGPELVKAGVQP